MPWSPGLCPERPAHGRLLAIGPGFTPPYYCPHSDHTTSINLKSGPKSAPGVFTEREAYPA